jgi:hypothetical protein
MRVFKRTVLFLVLGIMGLQSISFAGSVLNAAKSSKVRCRLTEPGEFKEVFGLPNREDTRTDGDHGLLQYEYDNGVARFEKPKTEVQTPYVLYDVSINGEEINIGCDSKMVLRDEKDLKKIEKFSGLSSVSLKLVDLRKQSEFLNQMTFDSETEWPKKIPEGFNPDRILELGKNPGLGIRGLHKEGINGQGIGIAIIDQPLLLGHTEYRDSIVYYDAVEVPNHPVQMHGAPVASIAVGKTLGVAPGARLYYFATPTWKRDNRYYAEALERVIQINERLPKNEQIRVVSISNGDFQNIANYPLWKKAMEKALAQGIYVSTCSREPLNYLNLVLNFDKDPDDPASYAPVSWAARVPKDPNRFYVPGGSRTVASHRGIQVYQLYREGGLSWSAPYLAGLAALAFQVRPELSPADIVKLIKDTATIMPFGKIVNPRKLISEAKALKK